MSDRLAWATAIRDHCCQERAFRPSPQAVAELAEVLTGKITRRDLESVWARQMLDEAPPRDDWRDGFAQALYAAAEYAVALQTDARADQAPGWDEFFRDDLDGPDLRVVEEDGSLTLADIDNDQED